MLCYVLKVVVVLRELTVTELSVNDFKSALQTYCETSKTQDGCLQSEICLFVFTGSSSVCPCLSVSIIPPIHLSCCLSILLVICSFRFSPLINIKFGPLPFSIFLRSFAASTNFAIYEIWDSQESWQKCAQTPDILH